MAHEYKAEAKASHDRKLRSYGGNTSSTVDKANKDGDATNYAGFRALNTDKQAGMAPLSGKGSMSKDTSERIMRKSGGKVAGATSLKRLDKAPRKGKAAGGGLQGTGQRVGPIPSPDEQQYAFDSTTRVKPGEMAAGTTRKKGGKVMGGQQDYESRSHESQGSQGLRKRQAHAKGGKADHPDEAEDKALIRKMVKAKDLKMKDGGRAKRASGGGAFDDYMNEGSSEPKSSGKSGKGKTTVNVIIGGQQPQQPAPNPMAMAALLGAMDKGGPGGPPPPPPAGAMPPQGMPPQGAPMMAPPQAPPPMPPQAGPGGPPMMRKDGGKVQVPYRKPSRKGDYPALNFGSGGGFGRKQKIDAYGTKGPASKDNY